MATMLKCISCGKEVMLKECLLENAKKIDEYTCVCPACLTVEPLKSVQGKKPEIIKFSRLPQGHLVAGIIGGFILAVLGINIIATIFYPPMNEEPGMIRSFIYLIFFLTLWAVSIIIAIKSKSPINAWRKLLISNACLSFALPISIFIFTSSAMSKFMDKGPNIKAAAIAGAGGITMIVFGVLGLFLGAIFLIIGLVVCKDKTN
jgi:Na+/phosphate symporter